MRANEFTKPTVTESNHMDADQVLQYVKKIHAPEPFNIEYSITDHPAWELKNISLSQLNLDPNGEQQDPYNRTNWVDYDVVRDLMPKIEQVLKANPIVVDSDGWIIDGNHRAMAAAEAGLTSVPALVPAEVKENFHNDTAEAKTVEFEGLTLKVIKQDHELMVDALDDWGNKVLGHVKFNIGDGRELDPQDLRVDDKYQGQGIARVMYDYVKSLGYTINRSWDQTDAGAGFWNKHRGQDVRVWENTAAGINKMFNNLGDPVYANLQRVALLAMQGRQQEAAGRLQTVIKDSDPAVQKKIIDAVNNIKPVTINGKIADSSTLDKSKQHNDWIINTFIPWVQSLLGQQGVAESENNDTAISLSKLGKFHPGADTLAEFVPERATAQYALHPDKWESTFYSLTNKDSDKLKYYGPKKISIPPGTLVGDMAIANKFYRAKTPEEKQQYAELYKASLQPYPVDVSEYRMPELLIPQQSMSENFHDGKNPGRKEIDPDVYEDLSNSIIARTARQIVPTIRAKSTPEGYVYLSTQDGLSLVIGCNIAGGSIDINIGSQPMETTSSGPHKGAVTKIIEAVYQAAAKKYGAPIKQGTLSIDNDAGHGVWQHIAQKLGLQHDAYMVKENFADGKNPGRKGLAKRSGVNTKASVSSLRKTAKNSSGEKQRMAHWLANMKAGRAKAKRK